MTPGFTSNPPLRWVGKMLARLEDDLVYQSGSAGGWRTFVVPAGFETDYATVPRILWFAESHVEHDIRFPAVLHDWLYWLRGGEPYDITRKEADDIFYESMRTEGAPWWKAQGRYWAVRTFGGIAWRNEPEPMEGLA